LYVRELKKINKYLGLIPIVAIALALAIELALGLRGQYVFNPLYLVLEINIVFGIIDIALGALSAKSYLLTGSLTLLLIATSFVSVGVSAIMSGWLAALLPNWGVTEFAVGFLMFAVLQLMSSYQASFRSVPIGSEHRKVRLVLAFTAALAIVGIISLLCRLSVFPPFFVNGVGTTLIDRTILATIAIFFVLNSILFLKQYLKAKSTVLYLYTLALVLFAIGTFGISWQVQYSDIVVWTGRIGLYFGTITFMIALLSTRKVNN
jgi:hypothetical protein